MDTPVDSIAADDRFFLITQYWANFDPHYAYYEVTPGEDPTAAEHVDTAGSDGVTDLGYSPSVTYHGALYGRGAGGALMRAKGGEPITSVGTLSPDGTLEINRLLATPYGVIAWQDRRNANGLFRTDIDGDNLSLFLTIPTDPSHSTAISDVAEFGSRLYITADDYTSGTRRLWTAESSDPTGTLTLLSEVATANIGGFAVGRALGRTFVEGYDAIHGTELWSLNDVAAITGDAPIFFADLNPSTTSTNILDVAVDGAGNTYVLSRSLASNSPTLLHRIDGSTRAVELLLDLGLQATHNRLVLLDANTLMVTSLSGSAMNLDLTTRQVIATTNNAVEPPGSGRYSVRPSGNGFQYYVQDLLTFTTSSTGLVPAGYDAFSGYLGGNSPAGKWIDGRFVIRITSRQQPKDVRFIVTDGTTASTFTVISGLPAADGPGTYLGTIDGDFLFSAFTASSTLVAQRIYRTHGDGSPATLIAELPAKSPTLLPIGEMPGEGVGYFYMDGGIYRTDGTTAGTSRQLILNTGPTVTKLTARGLFAFAGGKLSVLPNDGSTPRALGSFATVGGFAEFDHKVFFVATASADPSPRVYVSDGTAWGTAVLDPNLIHGEAATRAFSDSTTREWPTAGTDRLAFSAFDPLYGEEARWVFADATAPHAGTRGYDRDTLTARITFDEYVSIEAGDVEIRPIGGAAAIDPSAYTLSFDQSAGLRVTFANSLPDGRYELRVRGGASGVSDLTGNPLAQDVVLPIDMLAADLDGDGKVGFSDLLLLAKNYNQSGKTFSQGNADRSADGKVDFGDLLLLAKQYNRTLPAAAAPASAAGGSPATSTRKRTSPAGDVLA